MEALNSQRTEKLNRVKLVEKEKDELEVPKNEAMSYVKLDNELSQYKYSLQQVCTNNFYQYIFQAISRSRNLIFFYNL